MSRRPRPSGSMSPVHVVGIAATPVRDEQDAMLDELVFEVVHAALREAGLRKQDAGLSVAASMDVLDARSISSGLYAAAAGGYLNDFYRVEGDSGQAIAAALQAVAAGDVEVAIAVGVHNPETSGTDRTERRRFLQSISNVAFEPHADRPVAMTSDIVYALHAARAVDHGVLTIDDLATLAAREISSAVDRPRSVRGRSVTAADVLGSPPVAWPLTELMLPAESTGAVAVVLASPARAGRCTGRAARITGMGQSTGRHSWTAEWLEDPGATTRAAARHAYRLAGISKPDEVIEVAEISSPTPALHEPYRDALGVGQSLSEKDINMSGGLRSNYPGLANGGVRLLEVVEELEERGGGACGVSHSVDTITGTVTEDVTVMTVEVL